MEDCKMSNSTKNSTSNRIHALLDENSFVEVGGYVTARNTDFNMTAKETPADGVVTGYGTIEGCLVYVYSQDATVLGGSVGEMHARKITKLYTMAMKTGAPVIGLVDCAGLRLQEATDSLNGLGEIYMSQTLASGVIPQITAVFGTCGGGMAVSAAMSDFTFMETKGGRLFVNSPNAIQGNYTEKCNTASADFQSRETGMVDFAGEADDIINNIRTLISILPSNSEDYMSYDECNDDLNRICSDLENYVGDTAIALAQISDNQFFMETRKEYAASMVTGFIRLNGTTVGCVANRTESYNESGVKTGEYDALLSGQSCEKAARFVHFCDAFSIPVLTLVNVKGYETTKCSEKKIARAAAGLTYAFANATVPKVTVILGQAMGTAYLTMNSKSIGADIVYAWPSASIGLMEPAEAVKIMYADEIAKAEDGKALISDQAESYRQLQSSAVSAAKRGYVDDIIDASETRARVIAAFEMLFTKREDRPAKKHGTI